MRETLYVIAVISNPVRYDSRLKLYRQFKKHMEESKDVHLTTVELAYGDRQFEITDAHNPDHVRLRTRHELWHKENMINVGLNHVRKHHPHAKYVAWIDADIEFLRRDFAIETIHQLQHYDVVQMWQHCIDLGPSGEKIADHYSFMRQYVSGAPYCYGGANMQYHKLWHPGYAWAARVEALDHLGGLLDKAILGAGDNHMAHALVGLADVTIGKGLHPSYAKHLNIWAARAERYIRRNVGVVPGTIVHYWHGKKKDRRYHDRWKILVNHQYDPDMDLKRDSQGIYQLADHGDVRSIKFRDDLRGYFRSRNEDSIDTE
jgi:hypothetical protein